MAALSRRLSTQVFLTSVLFLCRGKTPEEKARIQEEIDAIKVMHALIACQTVQTLFKSHRFRSPADTASLAWSPYPQVQICWQKCRYDCPNKHTPQAISDA